ncbi:MAG: SUMF1/EgtB/PvdO family nonheme iron enzyme [Puniceicoccales bacterium]|jgi:formylglycine-generating enzyme required for sulfatase activity|nr:SUMF1/EgtB/PvdO family nonheme iron enzyme [Puniceicoccales bacterium]
MKTNNRITRSVLIGAATLAAVALTPPAEGAFPMNIETVLIEAPNSIANAPDPATTYGAVGYDYYIGKYEITQEQWKDFLNAAAKTDTHGLWNNSMDYNGYSGITRTGAPGSYVYGITSGYEKRPVVFVSLLSAKRFCNWLTNQALSGGVSNDTETGVYNMGVANGVRDPDEWQKAGVVALPTNDEWYKAAYYDPNKSGGAGYYTHSTTGAGKPGGDVMDNDRANYANSYRSDPNGGNWTYYLNPVGFYEDYAGAYGAVDMTGNVWEWTDNPYNPSSRVVRGAAFNSNVLTLAADRSGSYNMYDDELNFLGFRVASLAPIPEPSTYGVIGGALVGLLCLVRRKRRAVAP